MTASLKFRSYVVNLCEVWSQEFLWSPSQHVDLKILRDQGTYHLKVKVPTIWKFQYGRKIKLFTPFHLEFWKYGLWFEAMQFFTLFSLFSWFWYTLYNAGVCSPFMLNFIVLRWCTRFPWKISWKFIKSGYHNY